MPALIWYAHHALAQLRAIADLFDCQLCVELLQNGRAVWFRHRIRFACQRIDCIAIGHRIPSNRSDVGERPYPTRLLLQYTEHYYLL